MLHRLATIVQNLTLNPIGPLRRLIKYGSQLSVQEKTIASMYPSAPTLQVNNGSTDHPLLHTARLPSHSAGGLPGSPMWWHPVSLHSAGVDPSRVEVNAVRAPGIRGEAQKVGKEFLKPDCGRK